jgi:hypothetical protein
MAGTRLLDPEPKTTDLNSLAASELTALLLLHVIKRLGPKTSRQQIQSAFRDVLASESGRNGFVSLDGHDSVWDFIGEMRLRNRVAIENHDQPPAVRLTEQGKRYTELFSEDEIKRALKFEVPETASR